MKRVRVNAMYAKKTSAILIAVLALLPFIQMNVYAKTVAVELLNHADPTWSFCYGAADELNGFKKQFKSSIVALWYHENSPFDNQDAKNRYSFYSGSPPVFIIGGTYVIEQDASSGAKIQTEINKQKAIASPITISIVSTCPASSGNATVEIQNISQAAVSGTFQFVLKERGVKYSWPPRTFVDNVVRDMIPDDKGEAVTINAGQAITKTRAFSIGSGWVKDSCRLVAFVQKSNKEIIEACAVGVNTGTPILTGGVLNRETIQIRAAQKSITLYIPEKGKTSVSIMDIRGREIADFSIISYGGWVQLPEINWCGIVLLHIKTAQKTYREKIQVME